MPSATPTIYWFRHDLRLEDNSALLQACLDSTCLLLVFCDASTSAQTMQWNLPRTSWHRQYFLASALTDLKTQLAARGSQLLVVDIQAVECLPELAKTIGATTIYCEEIAAPEEQDTVNALRATGLTVHTLWQSSLLNLAALPFHLDQMPDVFTHFRQLIERDGIIPPMPLDSPTIIPPLPKNFSDIAYRWNKTSSSTPISLSTAMTDVEAVAEQVNLPADFDSNYLYQYQVISRADNRSSFPYFLPEFSGGASAALAHVKHYFDRKLAHTYKLTRNGLSGTDYSTKFSPWLASGALSARTIYQALKQFEAEHGASDGTYWIWFELLWRDYFRLLHLNYGRQLYRARGLTNLPPPSHNSARFEAWCQAKTGEPLVDAGMAELAATGYLSNRLRQIVASYLIYDLECDWRAGAAWFEAQLIDYDVYSNQGNWLYIAGRGTDPRNGRRFNIKKQAQDHDRDGSYQRRWNVA